MRPRARRGPDEGQTRAGFNRLRDQTEGGPTRRPKCPESVRRVARPGCLADIVVEKSKPWAHARLAALPLAVLGLLPSDCSLQHVQQLNKAREGLGCRGNVPCPALPHRPEIAPTPYHPTRCCTSAVRPTPGINYQPPRLQSR